MIMINIYENTLVYANVFENVRFKQRSERLTSGMSPSPLLLSRGLDGAAAAH